MNYAMIKKYCIANGPGIRTALFVSGCPLHCKGCFNQDLQDYNYGKPFTEETYQEIKDSMNEHIDGLSILGGEPLAPNNSIEIRNLCKRFKQDFPNKTIWLWSGYTIEQIYQRAKDGIDIYPKEILQNSYINALIDGPFIEELKDLNLDWRGSSNQKIHFLF